MPILYHMFGMSPKILFFAITSEVIIYNYLVSLVYKYEK